MARQQGVLYGTRSAACTPRLSPWLGHCAGQWAQWGFKRDGDYTSTGVTNFYSWTAGQTLISQGSWTLKIRSVSSHVCVWECPREDERTIISLGPNKTDTSGVSGVIKISPVRQCASGPSASFASRRSTGILCVVCPFDQRWLRPNMRTGWELHYASLCIHLHPIPAPFLLLKNVKRTRPIPLSSFAECPTSGWSLVQLGRRKRNTGKHKSNIGLSYD